MKVIYSALGYPQNTIWELLLDELTLESSLESIPGYAVFMATVGKCSDLECHFDFPA